VAHLFSTFREREVREIFGEQFPRNHFLNSRLYLLVLGWY
jgi:hypothetical protein